MGQSLVIMGGEAPCSWHLQIGACVGEKETQAQRQEVRDLLGRMVLFLHAFLCLSRYV